MEPENYFSNVHMDFHTPSLQREIGVDFEPERFASRLEESNIDNIAFFAKGHHGNCYYDTKVGKKHPYLERNLLKEVIDACHDKGIKVLAYYTLVWDNYLEEEHPDWIQRDKDGKMLTAEEMAKRGDDHLWTYLCLNSPYPEEKIYPQIREIIDLNADGLWFDILLYHEDACTCKYCKKEMNEQGLDPDSDKDLAKLRKDTTLNFAADTTKFIKEIDEDLIVTYNHREQPGYTSKLQQYCDYILIESLPVQWGYQHTPYMARYVRTLETPFQGMTGVFHRSWGDFGTVKHDHQLKYEIASSLSHGAMLSIGDHVLPRGKLEKTKYDTIGKAFEFGKKRKTQLFQADPVADLAVVAEDGYDPAYNSTDSSVIGASKALIESHFLFDIIDSSSAGGLDKYKALVIPSNQNINDEFARKIDSYVENGGKLIVANTGTLSGDIFQLESLGLNYHSISPYSFSYLDLPKSLSKGTPEGPMVSYNSMTQVHATDATVLSEALTPTTERSQGRGFSHRQAPPENKTPYPAITENEYGSGTVTYLSAPIFKDFYEQDYYGHRILIENILNRYLEGEKTIETEAPSNLELTMLEKGNTKTVNLINFTTKRPGNVTPQMEDMPAIHDISLRIKTEEKPEQVSLMPDDQSLEWNIKDGYLEISIDELKIHSIIEIKE